MDCIKCNGVLILLSKVRCTYSILTCVHTWLYLKNMSEISKKHSHVLQKNDVRAKNVMKTYEENENSATS